MNRVALVTCMVAGAVSAILPASGVDTYDHRVQYLESSGTQHIDTGIIPDGNTMFTATYEYVAFGNGTKANYDMIAGLAGGGGTKRYYPVSINSGSSTAASTLRNERYVFSSDQPSLTHGSLTRHTIIFNDAAHRVFVDGSLVSAFTATLAAETKTFYLFAANNGSDKAAYHSAARIYECSVVTNGVTARKFIPVIDANNVACMFDEVEAKLYYNLGTGTFTAGPEWVPEEETPEEKPWYLVEYLESTGTQWVDTGLYATTNTQSDVGYQYTEATQTWGAMIGGAQHPSRYYPVSLNNSDARRERYVFGAPDPFVAVYPALQRHEVVFNDTRRDVYVDGAHLGSLNAEFKKSVTPMYIFAASKSNGDPDWFSHARIWHYDVYENGVEQMNLVPAVDTNGVACFHDRVSGTNLYNKGAEPFRVGRIISPVVPLDLSARTDLADGLNVLPFEVRPSYGTVFRLDDATAADYDVAVRADGAYLVAKGTGGDAARVIAVTGDTSIQLKAGEMPACAAIVLSGTVRLTADCDWRGLGTLVVPDGVTIDLHGHNLTLAGFGALPGTAGLITDTSASGGELRLNVPANEMVNLAEGVSILGSLTFVKEGAGTLLVSSAGHSFTGGTDIRGGILRMAYQPGYYPSILGPEPSTITIGPDGIFDIGGNVGQRFLYVLNGGALTSSKDTRDNNRQSGTDFTLGADSVVSNRTFGLIGAGWGPVKVHMNGHTLHSNAISGQRFFVCNTTFAGEGTLQVNSGRFRTVATSPETVNVGSNLTVSIPNLWTGGLELFAPFVVSNYISHSNFGYANKALTVLGTYTPVDHGRTHFPNIVLADGATIDLSEMGDLATFGTVAEDGGRVSFADGATIKVKIGGRAVPTSTPIIGWTAETKPDNLDTLTFIGGDEGRKYALAKQNDGIHVVTGVTIFIR